MRKQFLKYFWVVLLVISSFCLGYYLKPTGSTRPMMLRGGAGQFGARQAPPLNFRPGMRR